MSAAGSTRQQSQVEAEAPAAALDAEQDLNAAQCLLVQAYVESGGDVADEGQFDAFLRCVGNYKYALAPRRRRVFDLVWHAHDDTPWERLAAELRRQGIFMKPASVRRQAMRAAEQIAPIIRARGWERLTAARSRNGSYRPPPQRDVNDDASEVRRSKTTVAPAAGCPSLSYY